MVPTLDVRLEVRPGLLERLPAPAPAGPVLQVAEDLRGGAVVDAAALARHALREAVAGERPDAETDKIPHIPGSMPVAAGPTASGAGVRPAMPLFPVPGISAASVEPSMPLCRPCRNGFRAISA